MRLEDKTLRDLDQYLTAIEREENVTVVAAWVMGSHARGVASDESDIDIKFIFVQPVLDYPSLTRREMSLRTTGAALKHGVPHAARLDDEDLEFMGWNALRFLELLGDRDDGNNPSAIECLCSPYTIRTHPAITDLYEYVNERFNVIELYNHYRGLAKRNWKKYMEDDSEPTVKRMLYIIRGVIYARAIRDTHELPTLDIPAFIDDAPDSVFEGFDREMIRELVRLKSAGKGDQRIDKTEFTDAIDAFIDSDLNHRDHIRDETMDAEDLDEMMYRLLRDATR